MFSATSVHRAVQSCPPRSRMVMISCTLSSQEIANRNRGGGEGQMRIQATFTHRMRLSRVQLQVSTKKGP